MSEFVNKLNSLNKNIDIIILGDHAFPKNYKNDTSIFNKFILLEDKNVNRKIMNHFDLYPSILSILGFNFKNNKLGLGYNIFNEINLDSYEKHIYGLDKKLLGKSEKYISFWK